MQETTTLFPEWKHAEQLFLESGFKDGDLIPRQWFEDAFGMKPLPATFTEKDYEKRQFAWLRNMSQLTESLLEKHQIMLHNIFGQGYRVAPPYEQTEIAQDKFQREIGRSFLQAESKLRNVRFNQLTDEQRRENRDALAKLSMLRGMQKAALEP